MSNPIPLRTILSAGTPVAIDHGFGRFEYGIVRSYDDKKPNVCGHRGNYEIEITGGMPACGHSRVGQVKTILARHITPHTPAQVAASV